MYNLGGQKEDLFVDCDINFTVSVMRVLDPNYLSVGASSMWKATSASSSHMCGDDTKFNQDMVMVI